MDGCPISWLYTLIALLIQVVDAGEVCHVGLYHSIYCSFGCCRNSYGGVVCCSSVPPIVGIIVAVLSFVAIAIVIVCCCKRKTGPGRVILPPGQSLSYAQNGQTTGVLYRTGHSPHTTQTNAGNHGTMYCPGQYIHSRDGRQLYPQELNGEDISILYHSQNEYQLPPSTSTHRSHLTPQSYHVQELESSGYGMPAPPAYPGLQNS